MKRFISTLLCLAVLVGLFSVTAFAQGKFVAKKGTHGYLTVATTVSYPSGGGSTDGYTFPKYTVVTLSEDLYSDYTSDSVLPELESA